MSLINQMLRDLQKQQDESRPSVPAEKAPPRAARHLSALPVPLLAGAGLGLFLLGCWWLAGALSSWMFTFEDFRPVAEDRVLDESVPPSLPAETVSLALLPEDADKVAEVVPAEPVDSTPPPEMAGSEAGASEPEPAPVAARPSPLPEPAPPAAPAGRSLPQAKRAPQVTPAPAPSRPLQPIRRPAPAAQATERSQPSGLGTRIHPDALPGALSRADLSPKASAKTPFGQAEGAYRKAQQAYRENRSPAAAVLLQQALEVYPGHLPARELLVDIEEMNGRAGEAMYLLAEGLEIAPDYMPFKKRQARLLLDQGDIQAAVQVLLRAGMPTIEADPDAHVLLAALYQRLGEPFLAAQTYRNLLVAWPQTGAFWVGLGNALEAQGLPAEARKAYRQGLATENLSGDLRAHAERRLTQLAS